MESVDLLYKLKTVEHEDNEKTLASWAAKVQKYEGGAAEETIKTARKVARERLKMYEDEAKSLERIRLAQVQSQAKAETIIVQEEQKRSRARRSDVETLTRDIETAQGRIRSNQRALVETFANTTQSLARIARGVALLGLVGEEDKQRLLDILLTAQSLFDIVNGVAGAWKNANRAVEIYLNIVKATKAETAALAAIEAARGTRGAAGGAASALAPVAGGAAGGTIARMFGGGAAGGTAIGGASLGTAIVAFVAAIGGSISALKMFQEVVTGSYGQVGTWTGKVGEWEARFNAWFNRRTGVSLGIISTTDAKNISDSDAAVSRMEQSRQDQLERRLRQEANASQTVDRWNTQAALARERASFNFSGRRESRPFDHQRSAEQAISDFGQQRMNRDDITLTERQAAAEMVVQSQENILNISQDELETVRQIHEERRRTAEETIRSSENELKNVRERIRLETERFGKAKEEFGAMAPEQQKMLIGIREKANRVGFEGLTRAELDLVGKIDTRDTREGVRSARFAAAERAGFDRVFGSSERAEVDRLREEESRLNLTIADQRELVIKSSAEEAALVEKITNRVREIWELREAAIVAAVEAKLDRQALDEAANRVRQEAGRRAARVG